MELLERHSEGVIALTGCLQSRFCRRLVEERPEDARAHLDDLVGVFGAENVYFEVQDNGIPEQAKANEGIVRFARELGRPLVGTADVHYLRREDYDNHSALLCVQTKSTLEQPKLSFDTNEFYLKSAEEMDGVVRRLAGGGADDARDRRALRRRDRARQAAAAAASRPRTARSRGQMLRRLRARGAAPPLRRPAARPRRVERLEFELGVIEEMGFESYFLIVWDFVKLREGQRHRGRPRPRLGGRLDRRLRAQHHRPRPARQRPAVRALPQPGAQVDAGHRHRLLGPRPRARDPLRAGEVRPRVGRADHHLRQDGAARGDPRRGAGARLRLRDRRPRREADPGADHGPQPELRRVPEAGPGAAQGLRRRRATCAGSSTSPRASRASSATTRSTPPRW